MIDFIARLFVFGIIHSLLALPVLKKRIGDIFPPMMQIYRLIYNLVAVVTFLWAMSAWHLSPVVYLVPGAGSLLFHFLQLICLALLIRCAAQTGVGDFLGLRQLRGIPAGPRLVTTGCYAKVRHPLYTLSVILLALNPVMTLKWLIFTVLSTIYFVMGAWIEERRLVEEFGEAYRRYQEHVPMFVPSIQGKNEMKP